MILQQNRQKTGSLNVARVTLLCMAATLVVGFSKPNNPAASSTLHSSEPIALAMAVPLLASAPKQIILPASRPSSFAESATLDAVLGHVSSRRWLTPSMYSPDRAIADLRSPTRGFHGVGFPDIRTHKRAAQKRYPSTSNPGHWARMISWRTPKGTVAIPEPIAYVHCMGLSPQAVARRADRYDPLILTLAMEYDVSASLIKAVITVESCFNNKALSPVGAQGLMQLMPETANWLKVRDPHDPEDNLRAGVRYLASLQEQFDSLELALAAYNAGPGNVRRYKGVPPFTETQAYVRKVQAHYRRYVAATRFAAR